MERKPFSKNAIASLFLSLIPIVVTNILAIVLGVIALRSKNVRGKIFAVIGIIIGLSFSMFLMVSHESPFYDFFHQIFYPSERQESHRFFNVTAELTLIVSTEETWFMQDCDRNGINDYWTYDVSCLYRMYRSDNSTKVKFIPESIANADALPVDVNNRDFFGDEPKVAPLNVKEFLYGYLFRSMLTDEKGLSYNQNPVGTKKILAANHSKFAFVAYPSVYGETGTYTIIINEKKEMYARDMGSDKNKIVLQWPSQEELEGKKAKWKKIRY